MTRRLRVGIALAFAVWGCGKSPSPTTPTTPGASSDSLAKAGEAFGKLVGTAVQSSLLGDPKYAAIVNRDFNYLTAEYEMKWSPIENAQGVNNFSGGDTIMSYAETRGMKVKGHALIWHGGLPGWVTALSPSDLRAAFESHIRAVAGHYRGRVIAWDVVNEAVADDGSGLRDTVFRQKLGDTYIADAFRIAREADPGALLFYNDYGGEGAGAKSDRIYALVKSLRDAGVPIDGVGLQMHISANNRPSDANIAANMRRLAELGLSVNISEMDVKINSTPGSLDVKLEAQRAAYRSVVAVCMSEPKCHGVTFWGFTDAHTWLTGDSPLLYDTQYAAKPAYFGTLDALSGR